MSHIAASLAVACAAVAFSACAEVESETPEGYQPAKLSAVAGSDDVKQVTFTPEGAKRTDLRTARVRASGERRVVPYAALIYDAEGKTYVYTSPKALTFVRRPVTVDRIVGGRVLLSAGPQEGTEVVTVGAAEVYGTELEIGSSH
jgi:hypothetical protein